MTVQPVPGSQGSFAAAVASQRAGSASVHVVSPKSQSVDDGAHGTHDYDTQVHPQVLGRLDAHGARLDNHHARLERLEAKLGLGSPDHSEPQKPGGAYPKQ